jgi:uncharacterized protein YcnI
MMRTSRSLRPAIVVAAALLAFLAASAAAQAHIQVSPTVVAPGDSVQFTFLVPGETGQPTTRVEISIPPDVLPFAYGDTPGWDRRVVEAANGGVEKVVWTGNAPADGFAEFSFLAGVPEQPGTLEWKAIQEYADGEVVRWIGAPDSEEPAPVTQVDPNAPRQNAGGEGEGEAPSGGGTGETATTETPTETTAETPSATPASSSDDEGSDQFARVLAIAALALGAVALALGFRARRS